MTAKATVLGALLTILVLGAFQPALDGQFVDFDDDVYVTANPRVRAGLTLDGARWAATSVGYAANWHPLTWLSHMLDVELFGLAPRGHHLHSVLIHAASALLLFAAVRRMTGALYLSWSVALLFAVHPLRVESVAWVAERKDVLSGFLVLATLLTWVRYARRPGAARYSASLGLTLAALLSKPMAVSLPLLLLVADWWPLGRFGRNGPGARRLLFEKLPFAVLAVAAAVITFVAQTGGGAVEVTHGIVERLAFLPLATATYLWKFAWPSGLAVFYPMPDRISVLEVLAAALPLAVLAGIAVFSRRRRPHLLAGLAWYVTTILPVSGVVRAGDQAVADRYTYIPLIGLTVAVVLLARELVRRQAPLTLGVVAVALGLAAMTRSQAATWRDTQTLFRHAVAVVEGNWLAYNNLGQALLDAGRPADAAPLLGEAIRLKPSEPLSHYNLGAALFQLGDRAGAEGQYRRALALAPDLAAARYNLGVTLLWEGRSAAALQEFDRVLAQTPNHAGARHNRGLVLLERGDLVGARKEFEAALRSQPAMDKAWYSLGAVLEREGRLAEAEASYSRALALQPAKTEARRGRDRVRTMRGTR